MSPQHRSTNPEAAVATETPAFIYTASRTVYAAGAVIVTIGAASLIGLEAHSAKEVALLNGGVAFYTHEAAGRLVAAIGTVVQTATRTRRS